MSDSSFIERANLSLQRIETHLDQIAEQHDLDIDLDRQAGVLNVSLTPAAGSTTQWVIHIHETLSELWIASSHGAHHFKWQTPQQAWCDTRNGQSLSIVLSVWLSLLIGTPNVFEKTFDGLL